MRRTSPLHEPDARGADIDAVAGVSKATYFTPPRRRLRNRALTAGELRSWIVFALHDRCGVWSRGRLCVAAFADTLVISSVLGADHHHGADACVACACNGASVNVCVYERMLQRKARKRNDRIIREIQINLMR